MHLPTSTSTSTSPADFEAFWSAYPRRVAKGAARKAYAKAVRKAAPSDLLAALAAQKAHGYGRDLTYTAHPATWLNQERWLDELAPLSGAPAAPEGESYGF
jgi:hypothetical protein